MRGHVYQFADVRYGNRPHLYAVVVEFSGNRDCIVVPAFSADGVAVNSVIQSRLDEGYRLDEVAVTLDNAAHVQFVGTHTGKVAHWLVSDADRLPQTFVDGSVAIGTMDDAGLKALAVGLLAFAPNSARFSPAALRQFRLLAR